MEPFEQAHAVTPTRPMFLKAAEQTWLLNYLHRNINFSGNERLCALTAQQKCMLLRCSNTLHSAAMCHSLNMAACTQQMERNITCHSSWLLSVIKNEVGNCQNKYARRRL